MMDWVLADQLCRGDYAKAARDADYQASRETNPVRARSWGELAERFLSIYRRLDWVPRKR